MTDQPIEAGDLLELEVALLSGLRAQLPETTRLVVSMVEIPQPRPAFTDVYGPIHAVAMMFEDGAVVLLLDRAVPEAERRAVAERELSALAARQLREQR